MSEDHLAEYFKNLVLLSLKSMVHANLLARATLQVLYVSEAPEKEVGMLPPELLLTLHATLIGESGLSRGLVLQDDGVELLER